MPRDDDDPKPLGGVGNDKAVPRLLPNLSPEVFGVRYPIFLSEVLVLIPAPPAPLCLSGVDSNKLGGRRLVTGDG